MNTSVVLMSRGLGQCINQGNYVTESKKINKAITIMCYHLTKDLREQYENTRDPYDFWSKQNFRFSMVLWQKAIDE